MLAKIQPEYFASVILLEFNKNLRPPRYCFIKQFPGSTQTLTIHNYVICVNMLSKPYSIQMYAKHTNITRLASVPTRRPRQKKNATNGSDALLPFCTMRRIRAAARRVTVLRAATLRNSRKRPLCGNFPRQFQNERFLNAFVHFICNSFNGL